MKKNILIATFALMAMLLVSGCNSSAPTQSIGVIDAAKIFNESKNAQSVMKHLEAFSKNMQAEVEAAQKTLEKDQSEANSKAFHEALSKYQTAIGEEQQRVVKVVEDRFQTVLDEYRTEKKLSVILPKDVVLSMDETAANVTEDIMKKMDEVELDFSKK
ncbi:MAG: OmpH family outer membrane protein [Desulfovibrio sp.]